MSTSDNATAHPSPWATLLKRDFFLIWTSGVFMNVSMVLRTLVAAQWLYDVTGSAKLLGALGVVQFLQVPIGLYGGALADRVDRKKLMIFTQVVSAVMLGALTWLAAIHALVPWHIFAATALSGITGALGGAARPAMLPRVLPRSLLTQAVAILSISGQASQIASPLLFWPLYDTLGVAMAFAVAMATAIGSIVLPFLIRASGKPETKLRGNVWTSLREGFVFLQHHPILPGLFLMDIGVTVVTFYRQLLPIFAREFYNLGAKGTGLLTAANSAGSIVGIFVVLLADRAPRKGVIILGSTLVYAVFVIFFGLNKTLVPGLVIISVMGLTDSMSVTMRLSMVQLTTPDEILGRASAVRNLSATGANNIGQIEVGLMAGAIGAGHTMVMGGVIAVAVVVAIWRFFPGLRNYRYRPDDAVMAVQPPSHATR